MKAVVTGASGAVGRRVCARLDEQGVTVVGIERPDERLDLADLCRGADVIIHLSQTFPPDATSLEAGTADLDLAQRVFDAATEAGVRHLVIVSSAMVYGAWETNVVPLTEDAPVRPNPEFAYAVHLAELERRALDWRAEHATTTLTILRPTVVVADEQPSKVAQLLRSVGAIRTDEGDPPAQFVHADDLASAIVVAAQAQVDGVLNVAPDGWIPPETFNALVSNAPRLRVPTWLATALASARWRLGLASAPPGLVPYTVYPWVVANDRLRSLGWRAENTNEEAFVAGHEPGPLDRLNARRRQQIALGVTGGVLLAIVGVVVAIVVRRRRRARSA
ncbi:MAG TPA: NAD-dependent epimerase/dehydratase family protein [Acidimicrobiales bacterium]